MALFERKKEQEAEKTCSQAMVDLAAESWRLDQNVRRAVVSMEPMEANRFLNQYNWYRRKLWEALTEVGLRIVDVTDEDYHIGMAVSPLNLEDFADCPAEKLCIGQMVEPIVMEKGKVRREGKVMLAEKSEEG